MRLMEQEPCQHVILAHYGELGLKGDNQPLFRRQLRENLRLKLDALGVDLRVENVPGFFVIRSSASRLPRAEDLRAVLEALQQVFGIVWVAPARCLAHQRFTMTTRERDLTEVQRHLLELANEQFAPGKTFAVRINRADKTLPFKSPELESQLGRFLRQNSQWDKVSLSRPDVTFHLDVRSKALYLFAEKRRGPGGLPVGTAGRVLTLLSGGIDSPVAAYLLARRGCRVDFIHFTASSLQPEELEQNKIWRLARRVSDYTLASRLFVVSYVYFDLALMRHKVEYELVLFRRFMLRVAEQLARRLHARALVTGDNLSQVASQTLPNLVSAMRAVELPVFQPLLGYDKEEIMALARKIGTYEISIAPYKDCCALISRHPRTSSRHEDLTKLEAKIFPDYQALIDRTLAEAVCLKAAVGRESVEALDRESLNR